MEAALPEGELLYGVEAQLERTSGRCIATGRLKVDHSCPGDLNRGMVALNLGNLAAIAHVQEWIFLLTPLFWIEKAEINTVTYFARGHLTAGEGICKECTTLINVRDRHYEYRHSYALNTVIKGFLWASLNTLAPSVGFSYFRMNYSHFGTTFKAPCADLSASTR